MRKNYAEELEEDDELRKDLFGDELRPKVLDAFAWSKTRAEGFYLANAVSAVLDDLTKKELLELLIVTEVGADFRRCLTFADNVEILFTEDGEKGEKLYMHELVQCVLRGYCAVKFEF